MTQPRPKPNAGPRIVDLVIDDLRARAEAGKAKYGTYLQAGNGRDPALDLYQELLDAPQYAKQLLEEREEWRRLLAEMLRCLEYAQCYQCGRHYRDDPGDCLMATHLEGREAMLAARLALGAKERT